MRHSDTVNHGFSWHSSIGIPRSLLARYINTHPWAISKSRDDTQLFFSGKYVSRQSRAAGIASGKNYSANVGNSGQESYGLLSKELFSLRLNAHLHRERNVTEGKFIVRYRRVRSRE